MSVVPFSKIGKALGMTEKAAYHVYLSAMAKLKRNANLPKMRDLAYLLESYHYKIVVLDDPLGDGKPKVKRLRKYTINGVFTKTCEGCHKDFNTHLGVKRFCSKICMGRAKQLGYVRRVRS